MRFDDALAYLAGFVDLERAGFGASDLQLERTRRLLDALGRPQDRYPSLLIAGTKGKGSTAAMIERGLRAAGYRTGLYTQPHLHTIRERVQVNGALINPEDFGDTMVSVRRAVDQVCEATGPVTAYEVVTCLALEYFARAGVDVAVLEVGLGGRLDATNVLEARVSVLTSISLDHTQILGDTVEAIAREKADIVKFGQPVVSAPQPATAMEVIRATAAARRAPLRVAGHDGARWDGQRLITGRGPLEQVRPALIGDHQRINAAVAATMFDELDRAGVASVPLDAVRVGIERVHWPGRFEIVGGAPPVVLDGAHNVESAERLRATLHEQLPGLAPVFVVGMASDKDARGFLAALAPARAIVATAASHPRARAAAEVVALARAAGALASEAPDVAGALARATATAGGRGVVVVTGSLYVVAEAREALGLASPSGEPSYNPWGAR